MIKKKDIIVLDDKLEYVVVDCLMYENNNYAYLCEMGNDNNVKFVQIEDDKNLSIIDTNEEKLLKKLILLFAKNSDNN